MKVLIGIIFCLVLGTVKADPFFDRKYAKTCKKYVNLLRNKWVVQREIPNLDQGPVGICYSHAATSLIDLWRDIHGLKLFKKLALSNPQYAAFLYKLEEWGKTKTLDGGQAVDTINAVRKYGMCRFDVIDAIMKKYSKSQKISTRDWYTITNWFLEFYAGSIKKEILASPNKPQTLKNIFGRFKSRDKIIEIYKNGDFTKIYNSIEPYLKKRNYVAFMKNVFGECFKKRNIYLPTKRLPKLITHKWFGGKAKRIIAQLDKKNPVGITYKADVLREENKFLNRMKNFLGSVNHQSVIAGKRVRNGKCQFLLKNSWGNYCGYTWECQKDKTGKEMGVWVGANSLMMATSDVFYFEGKK